MRFITIILFLGISSFLGAQNEGMNPALIKPAPGAGYMLKSYDLSGRAKWVLVTEVIDTASMNNLIDENNQMVAISPLLDGSGDTLGTIFMLSGSGGQLYMKKGWGVELNTDGLSTIIGVDTTTLDVRYLLQNDAKLAGIEAGAEVNVQSDWDADSGDALILNKPTTITAGQANEITANTAKNTYPSADASKLAGIEAGAEVNVQSDWDATTGDAFILNKPSLFDGNYNSLSNLPSLFDGNYNSLSNLPSLFSGSYTDLINKPTINNLITTGLGLDLEAINTELYLNFAELPTDDTPISTSYFVYADATEEKKISLTEFNAVIAPTWANVSGKPTTITAGQASAITANTAKNTYPSADATKLAGIATGAEVNVNADWDATTGDALVLNKPSLFSGSYTDLTNKPTINNLASANQTQTGANGSTRIYSYYNKGLWFASSGTGSAFTVQAKDIGIAATAGGSILIDGEGGTVNIQPASGTNVGGFMKNITTFGQVEFEKILGTDVTVTDPTTAGNNDLNTALSNINSNVGAPGQQGPQGPEGPQGPAGADGITGVIFQETGNLNFTLINDAIIRFNSTDFNLDSSNPSLLTITTNKTNMLSTNLTGSANPSHTNTGTWSLQNNLSNGATSNLQFTNTQSNLIYGKSGILGSVTIEEDGAKLLHTANIANGFAELNVKQVNGKTNVIAELENYANEAAAIADTDLLQFSLYRIGTDVRIKL